MAVRGDGAGVRVCVLTTGFPRFSGDLFGSFVLQLTAQLSRQGLDMTVVAPHDSGIARRELVEGAAVRRFRYVLPESWQKLAYGGGIPSNLRVSWIARLQILPFLVSFWWSAVTACRRCDIIHCHWTISGLVAYLATRQAPRPIVVSACGSDIHLMQGRLVGWLNRRVFRWVDAVIAVSDDIADKIEAAGVDRDKIRVVYNGVGPEFRPRDRQAMRRELDLPESRFIVLFVGLLVPVKGVDVLLQAMSEMADDRFLCVVVGDGPSRAQLERQAEELNIAERCRFAGQRPAFEIRAGSAPRTSSSCPACLKAGRTSFWRPTPAAYPSSPRESAALPN